MGNAGSASGGGFAAVYHNPAAMLLSDGSVGMGLVATMTSARVALGDRPDGFDVPDLGTSGPAIGFDDTLRPRSGQSLGSSYGMYLGATNGLGFERFRFGVAVRGWRRWEQQSARDRERRRRRRAERKSADR